MLLDTKDELKEMEEWMQSSKKWEIAPEGLLDLVETGLITCQDFCASREACGSDACRCIRAIFPYPDAYELFTLLREEYLAGRRNEVINTILENVYE